MSQPLTPETRARLNETLRETEDVSLRILGSVGPGRHLFSNLGLDGVAELFKVLEFTALLRFDTAVLFSDFLTHELTERAHVYARFLLLTIYESTKTYRGLLGKSLQQKLDDSSGVHGLAQRVRDSHKALSRLSDEVAKRYGDVRDGIAAHRDAEAVAQLHRLRTIGGEELAQLVERFARVIGELELLLRDFTEIIARACSQHLQRLMLPLGSDATVAVNLCGTDGLPTALVISALSCRSDNDQVATVDGTGRVHAVGSGYTRITFRSRTDDRITGGVLVFVGTHERLVEMDEAWRGMLRSTSAPGS